MSAAIFANVQFDVVIVGASVTGSAVATLTRERGLSVALVDRRNRCAIASNGRPTPVPVWALEESRLPVGEVMRVPARIHIVAGAARRTIATPDCVLLEPGALASALVDRAIATGATFVEGRSVTSLAAHEDGVLLDDGSTIHAKYVIDASGPNGAVLLILFSVVVFLVGLVSEQISALRFEGGGRPRG